ADRAAERRPEEDERGEAVPESIGRRRLELERAPEPAEQERGDRERDARGAVGDLGLSVGESREGHGLGRGEVRRELRGLLARALVAAEGRVGLAHDLADDLLEEPAHTTKPSPAHARLATPRARRAAGSFNVQSFKLERISEPRPW